VGRVMDIEKSFNKINWHDTKISSFSVNHRFNFDVIEARINLNDKGNYKSGVITFENCVFLDSRIYLSAKMACSDDISGASCFSKSEWIDRLINEYKYDKFSNLYHFQITFIPPGGVMNILAESFSIEFDR